MSRPFPALDNTASHHIWAVLRPHGNAYNGALLLDSQLLFFPSHSDFLLLYPSNFCS